jgi:hypothetical protein
MGARGIYQKTIKRLLIVYFLIQKIIYITLFKENRDETIIIQDI